MAPAEEALSDLRGLLPEGQDGPALAARTGPGSESDLEVTQTVADPGRLLPRCQCANEDIGWGKAGSL